MRLTIGDSERLCLDWDERSLRVLNVSLGRGGVVVRNAVHVPLPDSVSPRQAASLGPFIRQTLAEHRIRTRRVILSVPRQDAVLTPLILPQGSPDELSAMVNIQIVKELPFNKDQAVIDFAVTRHDEKANTCDVWVGAVRTSVIDYYSEVIAAAGLKTDRIGLRCHANVLAVTSDAAVAGRVLTVDVGPSMTEINVIREGRLVFSRAAEVSIPAEGLVPVQRPDAATAPPDDLVARLGTMDLLLVEISRTVEAYRATDPGAKIDRVVLAGTVEINPGVLAAFEKRFNAPATLFDVPKSVKWRPGRSTTAGPFMAILGLALAGPSDGLGHFNFLHPKEPEAAQRQRVKRVPMVIAAAALFVAAIGVAAYHPIRTRNAQIAQLNTELTKANADKKAREELLAQLAEARSWQDRNVIWLDTLKQLSDNVFTSNKDAYLTRIHFAEHGKIAVDMKAATPHVARQLAERARDVKDKKGRSVFDAKPGEFMLDSKDLKYTVNDELFLVLNAAAPEAKKK